MKNTTVPEPIKPSTREAILSNIKEGNLIMRPRWYFILKAVLLVLAFLILVLGALYAISFCMFILAQAGVYALPVFGFKGLGLLFLSVPWLLVVTGVLFVIVLELLVRRYSFGYRKPLLYSLVIIVGFVILSGFALSRTAFHARFLERAQNHHLPIAGPLYRGYVRPSQGFHFGAVKGVTPEGLELVNPLGEELKIVIYPSTSFPGGTDFEKGDQVIIIGPRHDRIIDASGIRRVMGHGPRRSPRAPGWFRPQLEGRE